LTPTKLRPQLLRPRTAPPKFLLRPLLLLKIDQFGLDKPPPVPRSLHRKIKQHLHSVLLAIPLLAVAAGVAEAAGEAVAVASRP
jgi:hypothetical protein